MFGRCPGEADSGARVHFFSACAGLGTSAGSCGNDRSLNKVLVKTKQRLRQAVVKSWSDPNLETLSDGQVVGVGEDLDFGTG